jgi:anthranilate synthase
MQPLSIVHASSPALEAHATTHYITGGGVHIERHTLPLTLTEARAALSSIARALDTQPGVLLGSSFEYPGRYSRYDIGLVNPPLRITCSSERVELAGAERARDGAAAPAAARGERDQRAHGRARGRRRHPRARAPRAGP